MQATLARLNSLFQHWWALKAQPTKGNQANNPVLPLAMKTVIPKSTATFVLCSDNLLGQGQTFQAIPMNLEQDQLGFSHDHYVLSSGPTT